MTHLRREYSACYIAGATRFVRFITVYHLVGVKSCFTRCVVLYRQYNGRTVSRSVNFLISQCPHVLPPDATRTGTGLECCRLEGQVLTSTRPRLPSIPFHGVGPATFPVSLPNLNFRTHPRPSSEHSFSETQEPKDPRENKRHLHLHLSSTTPPPVTEAPNSGPLHLYSVNVKELALKTS